MDVRVVGLGLVVYVEGVERLCVVGDDVVDFLVGRFWGGEDDVRLVAAYEAAQDFIGEEVAVCGDVVGGELVVDVVGLGDEEHVGCVVVVPCDVLD